jgi:vesicle transport protein SEC22
LSAGPSKPPPRMSIESGPFTFHYVIEGDVCYLTLTDKAYPKKLAFQYLDELQSEFSRLYGPQIEGVARPYAFIKFGESCGCSACV